MEKRKATIQMSLLDHFDTGEEFTTQEAYDVVINQYGIDAKKPSIRARIYEAIDKGLLASKADGVYIVNKNDVSCLVVHGDGRDLTWIQDGSIDAIITDHPWLMPKSHIGGNRNFTSTYDTFLYNDQDFREKARVLKPGSFLVEFIPEENADNYEYLYRIKEMAAKAGFLYYAKVSWIKEDFVANTGRKSKNTEDVLFFSKGPARKLRIDAKANKALSITDDELAIRMSGTYRMLPTQFNFRPPSKSERLHQAEKPVELIEAIIDHISLRGEYILDQFSGSGSTGVAALNKERNSILIEYDAEFVKGIMIRLSYPESEVLNIDMEKFITNQEKNEINNYISENTYTYEIER